MFILLVYLYIYLLGQSQSTLLQQININDDTLPQLVTYLASENLSTVAVAGEEFTRKISTNTSQAEEICQTPRSPAVEG
ncbi:unnamed protein product [Leptidea sinapis]|uniref:Uncharacterized protein n=1 Tax=Leptidea sinapis TaxID=189913 RepID=A0A5E4QGY7_9NEOP|nr:unnamed protein product [Leptidea sinapis]